MTLLLSILMAVALPATAAASDADTIKTQHLDEVVVTQVSANRRLQSVQLGAEQLSIKELNATPVVFGENDILRSLQMLPGVKTEDEGSTGFQVRGGTTAQNVILYDQSPVYNVGHLAGLLSAFNDDAIGAATLYKGMLPPQFGGAASAVLDLTSQSGDMAHWHGGASVGLLSAKAKVEGPLVGDRLSLLACARRSYADVFLKMFDDFKDNTLYFYDFNAKLNYQASDRDLLQLSLFGSNDKTALKDMVSLQWRNLTATLGWRHLFRGQSYSQTAAIFSNYTTNNGIDLLGMDLTFSGHIRQGGLRQNFNIALGKHELNLGGHSMLIDVKSAEWHNVANHEREQRRAWENALWAGATLRLSPWLTTQAGARLTTFSSIGGPYYYEVDEKGDIVWFYKTRRNRIVYTRLMVDPRISLVWQPSSQWSLKAGYTRTSQNLHALRGQHTSTPFDRYTLSSNLLKPQKADQVSLGLFAMTRSQDYDFSLEGYYRHIDNILDYRDGKSFSSAIEMERLVLPGQGRGYGIEMMARKNTGRLTGWLAYVLSWSENKIAGINGGRWYTANNDRRHDVNLVALYRLSDEWTLSGTWVYNSGQAFTAPSGKYEIIDNYIYYYAERNGYRAPDYHHLDVSATWAKVISGGRFIREWNFSIYNLYNRYNPYLINFEDSENGARTKAVQYSLFGILPSVSFTLKF